MKKNYFTLAILLLQAIATLTAQNGRTSQQSVFQPAPSGFSQNDLAQLNPQNRYLSYVFPQDSLSGFNEQAARQEALSMQLSGVEYHVFMYSKKRSFVNTKYGIQSANNNSSLGFKPVLPTSQVNAAPCVNEDFEASPPATCTTAACAVGNTLTGWTVTQGMVNVVANGNCSVPPAGNPGSNLIWVRQTPWTEPAPLGVIGASPFGGNKVLQMGNNLAGGQFVRISQTFPVTPNNALFRLAYRAALYGAHACCENPYLKIRLIDCNNNVLNCPQVMVLPPSSMCSTVNPTGWVTTNQITHTPNWQIRSVDLTPYLGSCVTIQIETGDCSWYAHWGYAFVDCECLPMTVTVNNIQFPAGSNIVAVAACGVNTATMSAPPGLGPYTWNGPAGSGITNNPNQTITTTMPGNYTLVMNPVGSCAPITKTVNLQFGTFPNAGFTLQNNCTTYTITNTGSGPPAWQTYTIVGPGGPPSFSTTATSTVVNLVPNTTYTIYQTVTNPQNCPATFSTVITTPNGPNPAFTSAQSFTQCLNGNQMTFNAAVSAGSHTYAFTPSANAPATGFSANYGPVSFSAVGQYTVTHTISNAGCIASTSSVVTILAQPTASITSSALPTCAGGNATLTGSGGPGQITWVGPNNYSAGGPIVTIPNYQSSSAGIYTMIVNNFGCTNQATVQLNPMNGPTVSVSNNGPVCVGSPITLSVSYSGNPSYFYWYHYTANPYFYYYGGYNVANPTVTTSATPAHAITYTLYIHYPGCPTGSQFTTNVQVINLANPVVGNTGPYCPGATIQLTANVQTATSFTWSGPSAFTSTVQNPTIPNATPAMGGVYTITTAIGNCKKTASTTVSIHPLPNPIPVSNSPVCVGQNINLTSNAAASYTWTGPNGFSSNVQNPVITGATAAMAGVYTLAVTSAQGCTNVATVSVSVISSTTSASNTGPYCAGANIQLNTNPANNYSWTGPNGFTSTQQNPVIANSTPAMSGSYTVIATVGTCTASAVTNVVVNPLPTPFASNTGPYCVGQNISLNVNAFNSYAWSGPNAFVSTAQSPVINNAQMIHAGNYVVTVIDANNCSNTSTTNVVVNPLPVITVNSPTVCENSTINLTATGGASYSWTGPLSFASTQQNPVILNATVPMSGNYQVVVTSGAGCTNTAVATVSVIALPNIGIAGTNTLCSQNFNGSPNAVLLTASGAGSYVWSVPPGFFASPNLNSPNITLTPPVTGVPIVGTMSVVGTVGICTNSAVYNVTVIPNPTIVPAPATSSMCAGLSMNLTVSGANSYTWSPSASLNTNMGPSVIANPANTTVYSIIGEQDGCKSATQNATLQVVPNPTVSITPGTPTICVGESISLTAVGAANYTWTPAVNISTTNGPVVTVNPPANMTYSVIGELSTCTHVAAVTVTVHSLPNINVAVNTPTVCMFNYNGSPNTATLFATGGLSYNWGAFVGMSANQTVGNQIIATSAGNSPVMTGTVTGFDGKCYNFASYTVAVIDNPLISVTSGSICHGKSVDLVASGALNYTWSPASSLNSATGSTVSASPGMTTVYSVFGGSMGCNSPSETGTVIVVPNPIITVAPLTPTICEGQSIGLNAAGAESYTWYPSSSLSTSVAANVVASPTVTTNYTVVGIAQTCTSIAIRQVGVTPLPIIHAIPHRTTICLGEKTTINVNGSGTYTWFPSHFVDNENSNFVVIQPTVTTNFTVMGQNGPCYADKVIPIKVLVYPVMELSTSPQKVCYGSGTTIFASGAQTYSWAPAVTFAGPGTNMAYVTPSVSTNYTVMGINTDGTVVCMMTKEILIDVVPTITANAGYSVALCRGETGKLNASGGDTYQWTPEEGLSNPKISSPFVKPLSTTIYTVFVSHGGFCKQTGTVMVQVKPTPTVYAGPDMIYNKDEVIYLDAKGQGKLTWVSGDGVVCADCPNSQIIPQTSGCYRVQAKFPDSGCIAEDEVCIEITNDYTIYIPNIFTPNDDGKNDTFLVYGIGITDVEVTVYDRWGEKLYYEENQTKGWDGTYRGEMSKNDVYVYKVNFKSLDGKKHTKTGHVTLMK